MFGGGGLTNEKAYALGKFARVALRTPNIDYDGRFCMSSAAAAGIRGFGIDRGLPFPPGDGGDEHAVEVAVGRLRTALGDPRIIQTVVKRGYRLAYEPERAGNLPGGWRY